MAAVNNAFKASRTVYRTCPQSYFAYPVARRRFTNTPNGRIPSSETAVADLEGHSSLTVSGPDEAIIQSFDTQQRINSRDRQLPGSRYQYHPPRYDRGPLHPVQSPPRSDPIARNFMPGSMNLPRLRQTFDHTISADLMTLTYQHKPPGTPKAPERERLRSWDGSSPYHENRPLRGPRGSSNLPLLEKDITFRNIPEIRSVNISCYVPRAARDRKYVAVARSALQSISGRCPRITWIKNAVPMWKIKEGDVTGCKVTIFGDQAYEFVDKLVNLVLPKIKDWPGLKGSGDRSGNIAFGLHPAEMAHFPEITVNYDMYPTKLLPGCHIKILTTATSDRQARLLLSAMGFPLIGKF